MFNFSFLIILVKIKAMASNALGLSSLVVGECLKDTLPLARDCFAIEVTETNEALARSEGLTRTKRQSVVNRS
jgi:hypothetical protein